MKHKQWSPLSATLWKCFNRDGWISSIALSGSPEWPSFIFYFHPFTGWRPHVLLLPVGLALKMSFAQAIVQPLLVLVEGSIYAHLYCFKSSLCCLLRLFLWVFRVWWDLSSLCNRSIFNRTGNFYHSSSFSKVFWKLNNALESGFWEDRWFFEP